MFTPETKDKTIEDFVVPDDSGCFTDRMRCSVPRIDIIFGAVKEEDRNTQIQEIIHDAHVKQTA